jgi:thiol-disulfide isomerase/thioredoxin
MNIVREISKINFIRLSKYILVWAVLFFNNANAQNNNDSVFNSTAVSKIQLQSIDANEKFFLNDKQNTKPFTLFVFLSPECPLCQNYSGVLNNIYKQYNSHIQMYGIISGKAYSNEEIKKFKQQYDIQFPLLIDYAKKLTSYLHAVVTPQVILLNNKYQLLYKGAIDNWVVSLGKQRVKTTQNFLHDALQQSLSNETVLIKRTKAVGCRINDY